MGGFGKTIALGLGKRPSSRTMSLEDFANAEKTKVSPSRALQRVAARTLLPLAS